MSTSVISAICTPLTDRDRLEVEGLEAHIEDQWTNGISGLLVAGSMGRMQLLSDDTYRELVSESVRISRGRGEILVGVGDTSFARTRDRIRLVEQFDIDGVVVLTPYFVRFGEEELLDYFGALADLARKPLYLYNLPAVTGTELSVDLVLRAAGHPNIRGVKCSCPLDWTRRLMDVAPDGFRIIAANPSLVDMLVFCGVREQLDGMYALAPCWAMDIVRAADGGDRAEAARRQRKMTALRSAVTASYPVDPAFTVILNARGIPGRTFPRPIRPLSEEQAARLLGEDIVRELIAECPAPGA